jgi:hypothetical protein
MSSPAAPVRPGELAADHPEPLVLGGEPLPVRPGVLGSGCNGREGAVNGGGDASRGRSGLGPLRPLGIGLRVHTGCPRPFDHEGLIVARPRR